MKSNVFIAGVVERRGKFYRQLLDLCDELGLQVSFGKDERRHNVVLVMDAIRESCGIKFETYAGPSREREAYFGRLIFSVQCMNRGWLSPTEVAAQVKRSRSNVVRYRNKYATELRVNKAFALMVANVERLIEKKIIETTK